MLQNEMNVADIVTLIFLDVLLFLTFVGLTGYLHYLATIKMMRDVFGLIC